MENFIIKVHQTCKPITIKAESEDEDYALIRNRIERNLLESSIDRYDISIRNEKQNWFKSFIQDNF